MNQRAGGASPKKTLSTAEAGRTEGRKEVDPFIAAPGANTDVPAVVSVHFDLVIKGRYCLPIRMKLLFFFLRSELPQCQEAPK